MNCDAKVDKIASDNNCLRQHDDDSPASLRIAAIFQSHQRLNKEIMVYHEAFEVTEWAVLCRYYLFSLLEALSRCDEGLIPPPMAFFRCSAINPDQGINNQNNILLKQGCDIR